MSHQFDNNNAVVAMSGAVQAVDGFGSHTQSSIKT